MHKGMKSYDGACLPAEDPPRAWNLCNPQLVATRIESVSLSEDDAKLCHRALKDLEMYLRNNKNLDSSMLQQLHIMVDTTCSNMFWVLYDISRFFLEKK
mgnify:FL=1